MVNQNNINRRGFHEWIVQRVSAVLIGIYAVFIFAFIFTHDPMHFPTWNNLFASVGMKIATVVVLIAILWHAWIGLWTVFTDYVKNGAVRLVLEILVILALLSYVVWCLDAIW
ncbi:MAG TPA: succinate dehydrogenase, hydrophobic membrane anchor protein [Coxiellaceae bacterium]|nr:MAG: succinate dehydrogenase, hydrophobic membrane anchor protein [Gammaproteobacteria bacterium RIFCSPHIGHO2_12_FULL_36_30]HLB56583.1 succinate dehydrogenase, hydrophobic membrane anchor protein [Coxiellaceae bacterium]